MGEPVEIAATVTFIHKSGNVHRQSIDRQTLAVVQRLQARGAAPNALLPDEVRSYSKTRKGEGHPASVAVRLALDNPSAEPWNPAVESALHVQDGHGSGEPHSPGWPDCGR